MKKQKSNIQLPYFFRFLLAIQVLAIALLACGCASASEPRSFSSDGCSLFPDGDLGNRTLWCDCCFAHDIAYWRGGTKADRKKSDKTLRDCVRKRTGNKALADMMYQGVRTGGHPVFPTWYRWAYGWSYGRGYKPLSEEEQQRLRARLDAYFEKHPSGYCPPSAHEGPVQEKGEK